MSKKKIIYGIVGFLILILGYFNYFADEKGISEIKKMIQTKNAIYENEDYYVEAENQIDYVDEKESKFEKAKAKIKGMLLSGDNVFLDKARNLLLNSNIVGISPNGWTINASELKYNRETEKLESTQFVSAKNEEQGVEISGNKFETNISMDYISLSEGVVIKNKVVAISADRASYNNETKLVELEGNIKIANSNDENKANITGTFTNLTYNINERNIYSTAGFELFYNDTKLSGNNLTLNDRDESFIITGDVKISYQDYTFDVNKIEKLSGNDIINIYGEISGGNAEYTLTSDKAEYNIKDKFFDLKGNIIVKSVNKENLVADRLTYNLDTKVMDIYGNNFKYTSENNNLEGIHFTYNTETKDVKTENYFRAYNSKNEEVIGTTINYNLNSKNFNSTAEIELKNIDYSLKSKNISYTEADTTLRIPEAYNLTLLKEGGKVLGKAATYNKTSGDLISNETITMSVKDNVINGKNIKYNSISGLGKIDGPITLENKVDNMTGNATEITIANKDKITLVGPIKIKQATNDITTENMVYNFTTGLMHFDSPINFKDESINRVGKVMKSTYNPKESIFKGTGFSMKDANRTASSNNITMYSKENNLDLSGNVFLTSDKNSLKTQNLVYNTETKDIILKTKANIKYENYTMESASGKVNQDTGDIHLVNSKVRSTTNDQFMADKTDGNLNDGLVHFIGNVKGATDHKDGRINFSGNSADLYVSKNGDSYIAEKIKVTEKSTITQANRKIDAKNIEMDLVNNKVYAKERPLVTIDNGIKGITTGEADNIDGDLNIKLANLNGNVYIKDINNERKETTELFADRGTVTENNASVYDNVKVLNKKNKMTANEGHYDMLTNKVRLKGNVHIDYFTEEGEK